VPVRIQLDPKQLKEHPLRVGLSVDAVDTSKQDGPTLAASARDNPAQETRASRGPETGGRSVASLLLAANAPVIPGMQQRRLSCRCCCRLEDFP
jgi:membrane fusion protein (multidrug efflux system)